MKLLLNGADMTRKAVLALIIMLFAGVAGASVNIHVAKASTVHNFTLYGDFSHGWGFTAGNITSPGPTITVDQGDLVNLTL
jgi:FtsP/CotA-like multicopper oxidase with cupredoxin domain